MNPRQAASPRQPGRKALQDDPVSSNDSRPREDPARDTQASQKGRSQPNGTPGLLQRPNRNAAKDLAADLLSGSTQDMGFREPTADSSSEQLGAELLMDDLLSSSAQDSVDPTLAPEQAGQRLAPSHMDTRANEHTHVESGAADLQNDRSSGDELLAAKPDVAANGLVFEQPSLDLLRALSSDDELGLRPHDGRPSAAEDPQQPRADAVRSKLLRGGLLNASSEPFGLEPSWWSRSSESDQREQAASDSPHSPAMDADLALIALGREDQLQGEGLQAQQQVWQQSSSAPPNAEPAGMEGTPQASPGQSQSVAPASTRAEPAQTDPSPQVVEAGMAGASQAEQQAGQQSLQAAQSDAPMAVDRDKAKSAVMAQLRDMIAKLLQQQQVVMDRQLEVHRDGVGFLSSPIHHLPQFRV